MNNKYMLKILKEVGVRANTIPELSSRLGLAEWYVGELIQDLIALDLVRIGESFNGVYITSQEQDTVGN